MNSVKSSIKVARAATQVIKLQRSSDSNCVRPNIAVQSMPFVTHVDGFFRSLICPYVADPSMLLTKREKLKHYLKDRFMCKIELFGMYYLPDDRTYIIPLEDGSFRYPDQSDLKIPGYWQSILEHSESEENIELKQKLLDAGLSHLEFSRAVARFYATIDHDLVWIPKRIPFKKDDILEIVKEYQILVEDPNPREVECIRIILGMKSAFDVSF